MSFQGQCPTCGAPIEFGIETSLVTICDSCNTIAGRGDGKLENYGKVADLIQTDSPLRVGLSGKVKDVPFVVTGRSQLKHTAGGVWDEWYVAFRDGKRWGWLAEAQGKYYLTFPKDLPSDFQFDFDSAQIEQEVSIPQVGKLKVVEIGQSTAVSAEGEIPFAFQPGETVTYADLEGNKGKFATLDNSQTPPAFYLGGEFSLQRLGISATAESREDEQREVGSVGISCPNCGGALEQHCPDTLRIVCPYCDSMLDVSNAAGGLKFLEKLGKQKIKPVIPLGTSGELRGRKYTVIGFMRRKVRSEGVDYPWQEYLLYTPRQGFHWLIHSESHWSLGKPVSVGSVSIQGNRATCDGKKFRIFSRSRPVVTHVLGEFYWEVSKGERAISADYVAPPLMLSREETRDSQVDSARDAAAAAAALAEAPPAINPSQAPQTIAPPKPPAPKEVNYTVAEYLKPEEVEKAFGVKGLRRPTGVAPNQPYPHQGIYPLAMLFVCIAMGMTILFAVMNVRSPVVFERTYSLSARSGTTTAGGGLVIFPEEKIKLRSRKNIQVTLEAPVDNSWLYLAGDFFKEEDGDVFPFTAEAAYYHGVSGGESWSEGGRRKRRYVSSVPAGEYSMRLEFQWDRSKPPPSTAKVTIRQGVTRFANLMLTLFALLALPLCVALHHGAFEASRWSESDFAS